jgi:hypothetical protein
MSNRNREPVVTLFTDAGLKDSLGTWAAWAKYATGYATMRASGVITIPCFNSNFAELCSVANGLYCAIRFFEPPRRTRIIIQCDNTNALAMIASPTVDGRYHDPHKVIRDLKNKFNLILVPRHVGAHRGTDTPRNAVNTWCDRECRRQRNQHLRQQQEPNDQLRLSL